ncbi:MAG: HPr-rel-A system PqqD family peptide chaperone [Sphingobium sp.]|uniref:HPr-rel-A system PqqD family peptide chaperone n=1 Tax=Sphingobium sp. TaxID=1912891 RepID=UPI000DB1E9A7|nr:HPr-rel-A system PqqD family peptide chaperone [Sphingobium sp.]PZU10620.1 MAG: HPr-rel-A system PqqD family peptide chaperone [Sphingobium sp.]
MSATTAYCRSDAEALLTCALDDLTLFYHRRSGQTHMVISPVPEILKRMESGAPVTAAALHDDLSLDYDLGPRDAAVEAIAAHLETLAALGLVRPT